ncbi:hypothetical protein [Streptomyces sp. NPDC001719]
MPFRREVKLAGWAGVSVILLGVLCIALTGKFPNFFPQWSESTEEITEWLDTNRATGLTQIYMANFAYYLMLWFFVGLATLLRRPNQSSIFTRLITPAATATTVLYLAANTFYQIALLAGTGSHPAEEFLIRSAYEAGILLWLVSAPLFGLTMIAAGISILHAKVFPRWTGWTALTAAALNIAITFQSLAGSTELFAPVGLVSIAPYALGSLWISVMGVAMIRMRHPQEAPLGTQAGNSHRGST